MKEEIKEMLFYIKEACKMAVVAIVVIVLFAGAVKLATILFDML